MTLTIVIRIKRLDQAGRRNDVIASGRYFDPETWHSLGPREGNWVTIITIFLRIWAR